MKVITATGKEYEVYLVIKGQMIDYVHIYVNTETLTEIFDVFSNPIETEQITVIDEENNTRKTYIGYTHLYGIQQPILVSPPGTWMIWLNRPYEEEVN